MYWLLFRFGILALATTAFPVLMLIQMPLTSDPSSWYFGSSMLVAGSIAALALFGFRISLGGKPALPRLAVD
jgi:hypothetical protein